MTGVAFDKNALKSVSTLAKYRTGYSTAWNLSAVKKYMKRVGLREPGTYNPGNQQGGAMFALPREVTLTGLQAGILMRKTYKAGATKSQLEAVRKMLSFAWQLTSGKEGNFDEVDLAWTSFNPDLFGEQTQFLKPVHIVQPTGLQRAFTTEYNINNPMKLPHWCVGGIVTWHYVICGARSKEDLKRLKKSRSHTYCPSEGWFKTAMFGGRAKLARKKETRPWYACAREANTSVCQPTGVASSPLKEPPKRSFPGPPSAR